MPTFKALLMLGLALAQSPTVRAKGINCKGSGLCGLFLGNVNHNTIEVLSTVIEQAIDDGKGNRTYHTGVNIACYNDRCAFFENGAQGNLTIAAQHLRNLGKFGCEDCGSDPTGENGMVETGVFTVNFVDNVNFQCHHDMLCENVGPKEHSTGPGEYIVENGEYSE